MKRALPYASFLVLAVLSLAARWVHGGHLLGNTWLAAFLGCILHVPVLSRQRLWLGYAALLYPFVMVGVVLAVDGNISIGWN